MSFVRIEEISEEENEKKKQKGEKVYTPIPIQIYRYEKNREE